MNTFPKIKIDVHATPVRRRHSAAVSKWWICGAVFAVLVLVAIVVDPSAPIPAEPAVPSEPAVASGNYQSRVDRECVEDWNRTGRAKDIKRHSAAQRLQFLIDGGK